MADMAEDFTLSKFAPAEEQQGQKMLERS